MNDLRRQYGESLIAWEARLEAGWPARQRAERRNAVMAIPEHEYRRRVAELSVPRRRDPATLPDARQLTDDEYTAAKSAIGVHHASLMR